MKKIVSLILCLLVLTACVSAFAANDNVVYVCNYYDYIDEEVLNLFEQETGIHVEYINLMDNEALLQELEISPAAFDVIVPSDYMVERLIARDMVAELDWEKLPNAVQYTLDYLKNPAYDPEGRYAVPYMWGTLGILYNTTLVEKPVDSWADLWDEAYANNVIMMDSLRDAMGIGLKVLGYSMSSTNEEELFAATDKLVEQKQKGIVRAYQLDETKDRMVGGEAALAVVYSGDAWFAIEENSDLAYVVPKEGSNIWVDNMLIPKQAPHYENALAFIDFMCRPEIARMNCEEIGYSSPNSGAIAEMGEEYAANTVQNPDDETVARCEIYHDIPAEVLKDYNDLYNEVLNAH